MPASIEALPLQYGLKGEDVSEVTGDTFRGRPSNRSFKLRGVRGTPAQADAYEQQWALFGIDKEADIDLTQHFSDSEKIVVEIGTGMGEATAVIAERFPETGFLTFEVHVPGVGALLNKITNKKLTNVRIVQDDARVYLERHLKDHSLDGVHLYFPDPWPKRKHHKRRIVQPEFIELISQKLKTGGYWHIATDWVPYAEWIMELVALNPDFSGGEIEKPEFRPTTRFEGQGISKGHRVTDLWYIKK
jgi:tRNA (guanine-N7-)-methyltransferase